MPRKKILGHAPGYESPETDGEWHGRVLEEINENLMVLHDMQGHLYEINQHLKIISEYYEQNPQPVVIERVEVAASPQKGAKMSDNIVWMWFGAIVAGCGIIHGGEGGTFAAFFGFFIALVGSAGHYFEKRKNKKQT